MFRSHSSLEYPKVKWKGSYLAQWHKRLPGKREAENSIPRTTKDKKVKWNEGFRERG